MRVHHTGQNKSSASRKFLQEAQFAKNQSGHVLKECKMSLVELDKIQQ